jgi:hypothetical protein
MLCCSVATYVKDKVPKKATTKTSSRRVSANCLAAVFDEVLNENTRRLNWLAMKFFVKRAQWASAAKCLDRVGNFNATGPV